MKVLKRFFCLEEKKTYIVGSLYTGKRTDLGDLLEQDAEVIVENKPKRKRKTKK